VLVGDTLLDEFLNATDFYNKLANFADEEHPEKGCLTMRVAHEVYIAVSMSNLSPLLDLRVMLRAIVADYSYTAGNNANPIWSKRMRSTLVASRHGLSKDKRVMNLLDVDPPVVLPEKVTLDFIKKIALKMYEMRKTLHSYTLADDSLWGVTK
jgi:hypothetical protein